MGFEGVMNSNWVKFTVSFLVFTGVVASVEQIFELNLMNDVVAYIGFAASLVLVFFLGRAWSRDLKS